MATVPDISYWQGVISVGTAQQWYAAGIRDCYVKIGGGDDGIYHDSKHDMSVTNLRFAGIKCHRYYFNGSDPTASADQIAAWLNGIGSVPLGKGERFAWDIESPAWSVDQELVAINRLASHKFGPGGTDHYGSSSTLGNKGPIVAKGLDLWVAQYGSNSGHPEGAPSTGAWPKARLWQYTSNGLLPGYGGRLDLSTDAIPGGGTGPGPSDWSWINQTVYPTSMIQQKINAAGYSPALVVDNVPGPATEAGIKWYQTHVGVTSDGIVGPVTAGKMFGSANPTPAVGGNITKRPTTDIQNKLNAVIGAKLVVDGKYGPLTTAAVEKYQTSVHITVDGIYGPDTDGHLFGNGAPTVLVVDGIEGPLTTQREQLALHVTVDGIRGKQTISAEQKYTGAGVDGVDGPDTARHLQQKLTALGYGHIVGAIDGIKGPNTVKGLQTALNEGKFGK